MVHSQTPGMTSKLGLGAGGGGRGAGGWMAGGVTACFSAVNSTTSSRDSFSS